MYIRHNKNDVNKPHSLSIVIFRNGGYISKKGKLFYNGQNNTIVNSYKYLGLFLTTRMTFSNAPNETANKARKGVTDILRMLWRLGDFSAPIFFKMFDAQIKPMLLYGSEIWGLKEYKSVEKVHTFALKKPLKAFKSFSDPKFLNRTSASS